MCISSKAKESLITQEYLKSILEYREDGSLVWKVSKVKRRSIGKTAGSKDKEGYIIITIDGKPFKAHRLVWLWHYGKFPDGVIDHISRDKADNRIENLRDVSNQKNMMHQKIRSTNTSGHCGVAWHKSKSKWQSSIAVNNKQIHLGYFTDINDAIQARKQAELQYGFSPYHGNVKPLPNIVQL